MINGIEVLFRPDLTAFLGPEYIPLEAIERVEVAKGPLSAIYGANAFIATINVITRQPAPGLRSTISLRSSATPLAGYGTSGALQYNDDIWHVFVAADRTLRNRSGLSVKETFNEQSTGRSVFRPFFGRESHDDTAKPLSLYSSVSAQFDKFGTMEIQGGFQRLDASGEFQVNSALTHASQHSLSNYWAHAKHTLEATEDLTLTAGVGASQGQPNDNERLYTTTSVGDAYFLRNFGYLAFDFFASASYNITDAFTLDVRGNFSEERHRILYYTKVYESSRGIREAGERDELITPGDRKRLIIHSGGAQVQASGTPITQWRNLRISFAARVDAPSLYPIQYSYRGALSYKFTPTTVAKIIAGRAYQTPSMVMLYGLAGFGLSNNVIGHRTQHNLRPLRPQVIQSAEGVLSIRPMTSLQIEASAYVQLIDDPIEFVQLSRNFVALNRRQKAMTGFELTVKAEVSRLNLYGSATYQRVLDTTNFSDNMTKGDLSTLFPELFASGGVTVDVPEAYIQGNLHVRVASSRQGSQSNRLLNNGETYVLSGYAIADATIRSRGIQFFADSSEISVALSVRNILDHRFSEPGYGGFDIPSLGRQFFVELRHEFASPVATHP